jgi:hypothetical protein
MRISIHKDVFWLDEGERTSSSSKKDKYFYHYQAKHGY